jgi:hypothetical protein
MTDTTYSPAAVSRLLNAVLHPETVEGWQEPHDTGATTEGLRARLADIINELDDPFIERQRAYVLLEEMESIETELEKG